MTIEELIKSVRTTVNNVKDAMPSMLVETAGDSLVLIQERVINTGKDADGTKSNYKDGYYKKNRKKTGRQTAHKDYRNTGEMWNNISIVPSTSKDTQNYFTVDIDALSKENRDKLKWNNERDNISILENTDKEKEKLQTFMERKINRIIKKNLG